MNRPFYSPELSRDPHFRKIDPESLPEVEEMLQSLWLQEEIGHGNVTLAMIRPELPVSANIDASDATIAEVLEENIDNLGVIAKFTVLFDSKAVNEFYQGDPRDKQMELPPHTHSEFSSRWYEFVANMTSGHTTILLLHAPDGTAIERWRDQVGHWDIENRRNINTIRGRFGINNYNNLIHGSDSKEAASREVGIIADLVSRSSPLATSN